MSVSSLAGLCCLVVWLGIDVSKKEVDGAIWIEGKKYKTLKVTRDAQGLARLHDWALEFCNGRELRVCLESTGDYSDLCALYFAEKGVSVCVVNPAWIKYYGIGLGLLNKTDKSSAKIIAQYAREQEPHPSSLGDPKKREFFRLSRRRLQLLEDIAREDNRRECPDAIGKTCVKSIKVILKALRAELRQTEAILRQMIDSDQAWKRAEDLIRSLPPLGEASARAILSEMPELDHCQSAANYAAAAGGQPTLKCSGTSVHSSFMNRGGRSRVRSALFMPLLVGKSQMPEVQDLYDRLRDRGRTHHQAMMACIRKVLMIVYGVLKSGKPYVPWYGQPDKLNLNQATT